MNNACEGDRIIMVRGPFSGAIGGVTRTETCRSPYYNNEFVIIQLVGGQTLRAPLGSKTYKVISPLEYLALATAK